MSNVTLPSRNTTASYFDTTQARVLFFFLMLVTLWIVTVNSITLTTFVRSRRLQHKRHIPIVSLTIVDLTTGLLSLVRPIISFALNSEHLFLTCILTWMMHIVPPWASLFHLIIIALERYVAINRPLQYEMIVTGRRLGASIFVAFFIALTLSIVVLAWPQEDFNQVCDSFLWFPKDYVIAFFLIPYPLVFVLLVVMYSHILIIARRQAKAISTEIHRLSGNVKPLDESRATNTVGMICGIALACYIPFWLSVLLVMCWPQSKVASYVYDFSVFLFYSNSGMNFLVYIFSNGVFRAEIKSLFGRKRQVADSESVTVSTVA